MIYFIGLAKKSLSFFICLTEKHKGTLGQPNLYCKQNFKSKWKEESGSEVTQYWPNFCNPMDMVHGILQARILGMGTFPLQDLPTQGSTLTQDLRHCRRILYRLNQKGSPRIPEWVFYPFLQGIVPTFRN